MFRKGVSHTGAPSPTSLPCQGLSPWRSQVCYVSSEGTAEFLAEAWESEEEDQGGREGDVSPAGELEDGAERRGRVTVRPLDMLRPGGFRLLLLVVGL